jgi:hypothetical protein
MSKREPSTRRKHLEPTRASYRDAARLFARGVTLPAAVRIAVVGTWLSLMNQGQLIVHGHPPWVKLALNYLTPFTVASLATLPRGVAETSNDLSRSSVTCRSSQT